MSSRVSTGAAGREEREDRLLRQVEQEIKSLRHGRVTVDVCDGRIRQVETTKRLRAEEGT